MKRFTHVIAVHGPILRWIESWYTAYGILGALASGFAALLISLVIARSGGSAVEIGAAVATQNIGALFAPVWGSLADRTKAYRAIFFAGFIILAVGFIGFSILTGTVAWLSSAFLIGFGTGASNTVATLFVVEFRAQAEWSACISWLQTFNACGSVLGMVAAGFLAPRIGMVVAAALVIPALFLGGRGLPVPGGPVHVPRRLSGDEIAALLRHGGPSAAVLHQHRWRPVHILHLWKELSSPFGLFLVGWFAFSLAVSAFASLYPVLMRKSFGVPVADAAMVMSVATVLSLPLYNQAGRFVARAGAGWVLALGYAGRLVPMAGMAVIATVSPSRGFWGAIVLAGLFQGVWPLLSVAANDLAASLAPFGEGPAIGLFNAAAAIATAFGAVAAGGIVGHFGYSGVPAFAAVVILAALVTVGRTTAAVRRNILGNKSGASGDGPA